MRRQTISIARDFSLRPEGRTRDEGPFSAQAFREQLLVPALKSKAKVVEVDLRGVPGYSHAFLESVFGGLVRDDHFKPRELFRRLRIRSDLDVYFDCAWISVVEALQPLPHPRPRMGLTALTPSPGTAPALPAPAAARR